MRRLTPRYWLEFSIIDSGPMSAQGPFCGAMDHLRKSKAQSACQKKQGSLCLKPSQKEQGSLSLRTTPERARFTLLRKRLNLTLLQQLKSEAPKQTSNSAEHQFSEQGSVSRPKFTFYCPCKVENRVCAVSAGLTSRYWVEKLLVLSAQTGLFVVLMDHRTTLERARLSRLGKKSKVHSA